MAERTTTGKAGKGKKEDAEHAPTFSEGFARKLVSNLSVPQLRVVFPSHTFPRALSISRAFFFLLLGATERRIHRGMRKRSLCRFFFFEEKEDRTCGRREPPDASTCRLSSG